MIVITETKSTQMNKIKGAIHKLRNPNRWTGGVSQKRMKDDKVGGWSSLKNDTI